MKNILKRSLALLFAIIMVVMCFAGCKAKEEKVSSDITASTAVTKFTVDIILKDGETKSVEISTAKKTLGEALYEKGLVKKQEFESGFYTEIDGVKADYSVDNSWWCVKQNDKMTQKGINDLQVKNGDKFSIEYTIS